MKIELADAILKANKDFYNEYCDTTTPWNDDMNNREVELKDPNLIVLFDQTEIVEDMVCYFVINKGENVTKLISFVRSLPWKIWE